MQVGTNPKSFVTQDKCRKTHTRYLCIVSFHAHIWLVIDFRVWPEASVKNLAGMRKKASFRRLFFCLPGYAALLSGIVPVMKWRISRNVKNASLNALEAKKNAKKML